MASYTIPEEIVGVPLFVPDANDFFSIGVGEMPNGNDCLVVHGDVSTDYKAFQRAQVVSPEVFTNKDHNAMFNVMSMVLWVKCSAPTFVGSGFNQSIMFAVMNSAAAPTTTSSLAWMRDASIWTVAASNSGANQLGLFKLTATSGGGSSAQFNAVIPANTWTMITFVPGSGAGSGMFLNGDNFNSGGSWNGANGTFPNLTITNPFFCIGSYANHANLKARNDEWRIGKLSFHSGKLNLTQRTLLYNSMIF